MALNGDARPPPGAHHRAPDVAPRRRRERARGAGRPRASAAHRRGAVRRRLGAGGGVLDGAQRDDRPRDPRPEHRAQRHRAAAEHARHAARLPVRRRRGLPHRHVGDPGRADAVDGRDRRRHRGVGGAGGLAHLRGPDADGRRARPLAGRRPGGDHRLHTRCTSQDGAVRGRHRPRRDARARSTPSPTCWRSTTSSSGDYWDDLRLPSGRALRAPGAFVKASDDADRLDQPGTGRRRAHPRGARRPATAPSPRSARRATRPRPRRPAPARGREGRRLLLDRRRADHRQGARRPRRHRRPRRARQPGRPAAPRRPVQGRHPRHQPLPVLRRRSTRRSCRCSSTSSTPPATSVARRLLAWCDIALDSFTAGTMAAARARLRRRPGAEPGHHHGHDVPDGPGRSGRRAGRLRLPRRRGERLLRGHRLGRPPARRAVQRLHRHDRPALPDDRRCSPRSTTAGAPARASSSTRRRWSRRCTSSPPSCSTSRCPASAPGGPATTHPTHAPHDAYPCAGVDQWCAIAVETDEQWRALRHVLGEPAWAMDPRARHGGRTPRQPRPDRSRARRLHRHARRRAS